MQQFLAPVAAVAGALIANATAALQFTPHPLLFPPPALSWPNFKADAIAAMQQLQAAAAAAVTLQDCAYCACSLALFAAAWPTAIRAIAAATASSADAAIDCGASAQPAASAASVAYTPPKLPPPPLKGPSAAASQKSLTSSSSTSISSTSTSATTALNPAAAPIQSQFSALGTSRYTLGPVRTQPLPPPSSASGRPKSSLAQPLPPTRPVVFANVLPVAAVSSVSNSRHHQSDDLVVDADNQKRQLPQHDVRSDCSGSDDRFHSGEDDASQQQHAGDVDQKVETKESERWTDISSDPFRDGQLAAYLIEEQQQRRRRQMQRAVQMKLQQQQQQQLLEELQQKQLEKQQQQQQLQQQQQHVAPPLPHLRQRVAGLHTASTQYTSNLVQPLSASAASDTTFSTAAAVHAPKIVNCSSTSSDNDEV